MKSLKAAASKAGKAVSEYAMTVAKEVGVIEKGMQKQL